jgi:hypothetical protein
MYSNFIYLFKALHLLYKYGYMKDFNSRTNPHLPYVNKPSICHASSLNVVFQKLDVHTSCVRSG